MTEHDKNIFQNLLDYYLLFCQKAGVKYGQEKGVYWFMNEPGKWPNWTLGQEFGKTTFEQEIEQLVEKIKNKELPPFWNVVPGKLQNETCSILEKNGFRQIFRWTGMSLSPSDYTMQNEKPDKKLILKTVETVSELNDFLYLINNFILDSRKIDMSMLEPFLGSENLKMFIAYENQVPVSTSMSLMKGGIAGLYLISTHEEYRGKGYGTLITRAAIDFAIKNNTREIILHASPNGLSMYKKMGFNEYGMYNIYWLMGKEYR